MIKDYNKIIILITITLFVLGTVSVVGEADGVKIKKTYVKVKAKPSCQSCYKTYKYKWHKRKFLNYCPHCKKYNTLRVNPKRVYEVEITCQKCDSDYCGVCGHDKCSNYRRHKKYKLMRC